MRRRTSSSAPGRATTGSGLPRHRRDARRLRILESWPSTGTDFDNPRFRADEVTPVLRIGDGRVVAWKPLSALPRRSGIPRWPSYTGRMSLHWPGGPEAGARDGGSAGAREDVRGAEGAAVHILAGLPDAL